MPLGTAHETPTPSFSSRRSQWRRLAWCSWTTNRSARAGLRSTRAPGSGVFLKSRLASYSASFFAISNTLGHSRFLLYPAMGGGDLGLAPAADEQRRPGGKHQDGDRQHQRRVHGVDE